MVYLGIALVSIPLAFFFICWGCMVVDECKRGDFTNLIATAFLLSITLGSCILVASTPREPAQLYLDHNHYALLGQGNEVTTKTEGGMPIKVRARIQSKESK